VRRTALVIVFALPTALCAAWTVLAGKDVNWDLLNYHYYVPYQLLAGRLHQDFFAASAQSYLNPLGYLPFYLMVSSGWHSVLASIALAALHGLSIPLLYFLAWRLFAHLEGRDRVVFSALATALGAATSVYWTTVGSSYLDPLLVPPMLAAVLLLLDEGRHPLRRAVLSGALFGVAAALKYSNALFALAALPLAAAIPGLRGAERWRAGLGYIGGGALAVALLAGPWLVLLLREFGNPVFPLMNGWFRSPDAAPVNMVGARFTLAALEDAATFAFRMVALDSSLYFENFAPDLRFAALLVAALVLCAAAAFRGAPAGASLRATDWRVLAFFSAALALWLATSANARYGLVVLVLAGVCLSRIVERLLPPAAARTALVLLLALQLGMAAVAAPRRGFVVEPWSTRWLPYEAPERARREAALYLSIEVLPMAVVAPSMHPGASFVNLRGQHSIPLDSTRLAALLARHRDHVRTLGRELEIVDGKPQPAALKRYDDTLVRIGYRVDPADCFTIAWRPERDDLLSRAANRLTGATPSHEPLSVVSCALRAAARDPAQAGLERRVSLLFDRIEKACPRLFRGQTAVTEPLVNGWSRNYAGLDARLEAFGDRVILNLYRAGRHFDLGLLSAWEQGDARPAACGQGR
jgi:hypothetical protein